jgi:hypothetical protein
MLTFTSENSLPTRILIFSQDSFRDTPVLLRSIAESFEESGIQMEHVIFVPVGEEGREAARHGITHISPNRH